MIYVLASIVIPVVTYFVLPHLIAALSRKPARADVILLAACLAYFVAWYLPSPLIHGEDTAFTTHLIGGGIFSGLLWLYTKRQLGWHLSSALELVSLYIVVSALGVANELAELLLVQRGVINLTLADTSWDLLANTLGAILFWLGYKFFTISKKSY